jgi:hypothetical protein
MQSDKFLRISRIVLISFTIASVVLIAVALNFQQPAKMHSAEGSVNCQTDYCLDWVYGSCSRPGQRYRERTCFDYPSSAASASACEQNKRIFYERGEAPDPSC